jgi:trimethylamine:corrinoid methyltransferase-like protein
VRALFRDVPVNEETLALDLISEVAQSDHRAFTDSDHTAALFRQHLWHPAIFDRRNWQGAEAERHRDRELLGKADQTWREALRNSPPFELPGDKQKAVDDVLRRARAELL